MNKPDFSSILNDPFTQTCISRLKSNQKRIVFSEGEDLRVLQVAEKMVQLEIASPMLIGNREKIDQLAQENGIDLTFVTRIEPRKSSDFPRFVSRLKKIESLKGARIANPEEMMASPHRYACMMVQYGHADAYIGGNKSHPSVILRAVHKCLKPDPRVPHAFACTLLIGRDLQNFGRDGYLFLADTAINPEPDIETLASITLASADFVTRLFPDVRPRAALLSHSSKGSNSTPSALRVAAAAELAHARAISTRQDVEIDGEIQADVALNPIAAEKKVPHMDQKGPVDVLVFPSLDAAHISSKLLQHAGGAVPYGQFILGMSRPVAQIPMTCSPDTILGTALALAYEALNARRREDLV